MPKHRQVMHEEHKVRGGWAEASLVYPDGSRVITSTNTDGLLLVELYDDHNQFVETLLETDLQTPWRIA